MGKLVVGFGRNYVTVTGRPFEASLAKCLYFVLQCIVAAPALLL